MSDNRQQTTMQEQFADIFEQLRDQDIEQFYANYQLWVMRRRLPILENEIETLRTHIAENQQCIQDLRPSAIALAVLARLQSNGVCDTELLDQMLERGEEWLDHTMQRLDYCEQVEDFIQGDYTQWCANSLEGAYDWIDSIREAPADTWSVPSTEDSSTASEIQATTELLLHKLSFDDEEEAMQDATQAQLTSSAMHLAHSEDSGAANLEDTENAPYAPELEIVAAEDAALANTTDATTVPATTELEQVSSPEPTNASTQPAPWYSVNLEENEAFDFDRPDSMDDWITVLQSDLAPDPVTDAPQNILAQVQVVEPSNIVPVSELSVSVEQEEPLVSAPLANNDETISLDLASEVEISEIAPPNLEAIHEAATSEVAPAAIEIATSSEHLSAVLQEEPVSPPEMLTEQVEDTQQEIGKLLVTDGACPEESVQAEPEQIKVEQETIAEPEQVQVEQETINAVSEQLEAPQEVSLPNKKVLHKAKKMLKPKQKPGSKYTPKITLPASEQDIAEKTLAPAEQEQPIAQETTASDRDAELEQPTNPAEIVNETAGAEQSPQCGTEEVASITSEVERVSTELEKRVPEGPTLIAQATQPASEAADIINAIFEPEEEQLPWYEYLVMDQAGDEAQKANGTTEHNVLGGEPSSLVAEQNDKTQPIELKEIRLAQEQQSAPTSVLPINASESFVEQQINAHKNNAAPQVSVRVESEAPSGQDVSQDINMQETIPVKKVTTAEDRRKSEYVTLPQVAIKLPPPIQEKPQKIGFWRRLWQRIRKT